MDQQELLKKIAQIEEHARDGVAEFPNLGAERFRMILAYARYLRAELSRPTPGLLQDDTDTPSSDEPSRRLN